MQSPLRTTILNYLAQGLKPAQIAAAVNCSPTYIAQLMSDEEFMAQVNEKQAAKSSLDSGLDTQLDRIEKALLDKLESSVPLFLRPEQALNAWKVINAGRRRGINPISQHNTQNNTTVVQLNLPQVAMERFATNAQNQVLEAGGQTLVTMQPQGLDKLREKYAPPLVKLGGQEHVRTLPSEFNEFGL